MNWLTNFVRPRLRALVSKEVPDNLWHKCSRCEKMIFHRDLTENLHVCRHCGYHFRLSPKERLALLFDHQAYTRIPLKKVLQDPLKFKDLKKYTDRLKEARQKTLEEDAILTAEGKILGYPLVIAAFDFNFIGGSMGMAVGDGIIEASQVALQKKIPLLVIPASGGARMQEGILSLMQMPRTTISVRQLKDAGIPFITLLTDPTAGGVTASFAMLGDVSLAEPGATICFSGRRIIEQIVKEKLPDNFQTAEFLKTHGMIDQVVSRRELRQELGKILSLFAPLSHSSKSK